MKRLSVFCFLAEGYRFLPDCAWTSAEFSGCLCGLEQEKGEAAVP